MSHQTEDVIILLDSDDEDDVPSKAVVASRVLDDGCIEILDSDDEEDDSQKPSAVSTPLKKKNSNEENLSPNARRRLPGESPPKKQKIAHSLSAAPEEEVTVLSGADVNAFVPAAASIPSQNNDDNDDDIELLGSSGPNALIDFPHARENCVQFVFANDPSKHCTNCYCYVCDAPVQNCISWSTHCKATHKDPFWKRERQRHRQQKSVAPAAAAAAPQRTHNAAAPHCTYNSNTLQHILQHRVPNPAPHNRRLNPASVKSLLEAVTRVYPNELSPPPPFRTALRHYQKQSLAFMMDVEESGTSWKMNGIDTRGGWLCSEVGMGKSAVVIALVASQPFDPNQPKVLGRKCLKGTVIMTSVSLLGQWEDECKKHAPHLKVVRYHPPSQTTQKTRVTKSALQNADIIISSATFSWDIMRLDDVLFHRVVMDESHLFYSRNVSANPSKAQKIPAANRWCVTATPMTATATELELQSQFLGMPMNLRCAIQENPDTLKNHMIRHIKSQQINGSTALALPKSTTNVKMIAMTSTEQIRYNTARSDMEHRLRDLRAKHECGWYHLTNTVLYSLTSPLLSADSSKMQALENAILDLKNRDPDMRAVVFTQFRGVLHHVSAMVERLRIPLYSFSGESSTKQRDEAIRQFQSTASHGPAVFVITLATGSVGITLTAASHVFLMEPCINPADETQAAGRIHRLGQTKQVAVTKFVYSNSFESNTIKLHEEIAAGRIQFTAKGVSNAALQVLLRDVV